MSKYRNDQDIEKLDLARYECNAKNSASGLTGVGKSLVLIYFDLLLLLICVQNCKT